MKHLQRIRRSLVRASMGLVSLLTIPTVLHAADRTWSGASGVSGNWNDALNWDALPVASDNLIFTGATQLANTNDFAGLTAGWLRFDTGGFTPYGNGLTMGGGITNVSGDNVLELPLSLNAAQTFQVEANSLTFNRAITNSGDLTIAGAGSVTWGYVPSSTPPARGLFGPGNLIVNGNLTVNGGFVYPVNGNNFAGHTIVNNGGVLTMAAGNFDGNSLIGQSLTINTGGTVHTSQPHIAGSNGRPLSIYAGTLNMGAESYFTTIVLSNATINGPNEDLRGNGAITNLAAAGTTTFGVALNLTSSRTIAVEPGTADPAIDFTGNGIASIQGGNTLTKVGAGKMRISGPATHTGATVISAGTLALASTMDNTPSISIASNAVFDVTATSFSLAANQTLSGAGAVIGTLNDNNADAVLSPGGNNAAGTLTIDTLNLAGNLAIPFDLANNAAVGGVNDLLVVTNLTLPGSTTNLVSFNFISGTPVVGTPYTFIKYTTGPGTPGIITTLAAESSRFSFVFSNDTVASAIKVYVSGTPAPLLWKGDGATNTWDVAATTNWFNGAPVKDVFLQGDNVTFNDSGSNTPPVNIVGSVQPTTFTVNSTKDYVFAGTGKITGGGRLLKSNSGNLTLLTANDYTGGGSLTGSGVVTVGNGGTTAANLGSGSLTNNTKVTFFQNASATYAGNMSGSGSVTAFVPGATLTMTGTNTFTGGLTVANGTVQIGNSTPGSRVTGNITNYGTLNVFRSDAFTNQTFITSAGNTYQYGNGDFSVRSAGGMTVDGTAPISLGGSLSVAQGGYGKMTVNPGAAITAGGSLLLGNPNGAANNGDVIQNGGNLSVSNQVRIGHWASEISTYTMNGGTLNIPNNQLAVGWDGIGVMNVTGGTINCRTLNIDDNGATAAIGGTNSTFAMTGGQLNVGTGGIGGSANAIVRLGGGTIAASAPAGFASSLPMILTNGTGPTTIDSANSLITLSGVLSGTNGLVKQGSGYLNLNNVTNTFTGPMTVAQGTLQGSGTIVGPVTVQSGASLSAGSTLVAGTLTLSNLTLNSGAGLTFDLNSTAASGDQLVVRGPLALDATTTPATLNFLGGVPFTGTPYTLITNLAGRSGNLSVSSPTRYVASVDQSHPNRINVTFTGTNASLVWKGNLNNQWDVNGNANWLNGGVADKYFQSDAVIFDGTGSSTPNVVLAGNVTPASVTVNASGNYSFSGAALAGVGTLTKSGSGTLTVSNNLNYTGTTTVSGGTLRIGNGGTTGFVAGNIVNFGSVIFNRADTVTYGINPVNLAAATLSGPGSVTQAGAGKLVLVSTSTHTGGTTINPGSTLQLGNGALVDVGSLGSSPTVNNGTVILYRAGNIAVATPFSGPGTFVFQGTGNAGQSGYVLGATNTFTGPVSLSYSRIQSGAGAASFGNPASITVPAASQVYAVATPFSSLYNTPLTLAGTGWQDGLGALRIENGGTWAGNVTLANNARIGVNNATTNTISGTIAGSYELETYGGNAAAALVLSPSAPNTYSALRVSIGAAGAKTIAGNNNAIPNNIPLTMNGGTLWLNGFSKSFSPFLNLNNSSSIQNGSASSPVNLTLAPVTGPSTYGGTFGNGGAQPLHVTLTQSPGLWTLTLGAASPTLTGNVTNNGGAIITSVQNTGLGANNAPNRFIVANNGGSFTLNINNVFGNGVGNNFLPVHILNAGASISNNQYNVIGSVVLNGATLTGTRTAGTSYQMYQFRGPVTVTGSAPSRILNTAGLASNGDHLDTTTDFNVADVTGNANADLIVSVPLLNRSADYGGTGALTKNGSGTMQLNSANTYTGPTLINAGTLALADAASLASPSISIASGATLDVSALAGGLNLAAGQTLSGRGTVKGNLSDTAGSVLSPGSSAGTLTVTGDLNLNGGNLAAELANVTTVGTGVNDLLQVNGNLNLSAGSPTLVVFSFLNGAPALGTPYTLVQCAGTISGSAATAFTNSPSRYVATYSQSGNTITVTFSGSASNLVWTGSDPLLPGVWDIAATTNWSDGTGANAFYDFDSVTFDDTAATPNVTLDSTVTPTGITVNNAIDYSISGAGGIAGNTGITKNNTGALTLGTANTFAGPLNINGGKVLSGNANALPVGAAVNVAAGSQFDYNGNGNSTTRAYSFTIAGSGPDGNGAIVNSGASVFGNASVSNLTLTADSVIGGVGRWDIGTGAEGMQLKGNGFNLTKVGTLTVSMRPEVITNVASITVSNGVLYYENFHRTNSATAAMTNYVAPGATLGNYGARTVNVPVVLDGATINNQGGGSPAVWTGSIVVSNSSVFNNGNGAQTFLGVISGPGAMWVDGGSQIINLSNNNTYAGGTVISNAPVTPGPLNAGAGVAGVVVANPGSFGSGPITISGLANSAVVGGNLAYYGTNVLRAVEFNFSAPGTVANGITLPSETVSNVALHLRSSSQVVNLTGVISGGFAGMTNWVDVADGNGGGVMRYANPANTYLGTLFAPRGNVAITADGALGNAANLLRLNQGASAVTGPGLRFDAPGINVAHNVLLSAGAAFNLFGDNDGNGIPETMNSATISGVIAGAATAYLNGTNTTLTLSGNNTMSGGVEVASPMTLQVGASANLGTAYVGIKQGATFRYTGSGSETMTRTAWIDTGLGGGGGTIDVPNSSAALTWNPGGGAINQNLTKTGAGALTLGTLGISGGLLTANGGSLTVNSVISGAATMVQVSSGTLTLNGGNTYGGGTFVNGGTLFLNGSLPAGNNVAVASGATLGGVGTINCPVSLAAGANLSPGVSGVGKLTVASTLALAGTTTMELNKAAGTNDSVASLSSITYGGTLNVSNLGGTLAAGDKFTLFSAVNRLGSFATVNLPPLSGSLYWTNTLAFDGSIQVLSPVNLTPTNLTFSVSGNTMNLSWPASHLGWRLQAQTNSLSVGVNNNWVAIPGSESVTSMALPINPANPTVFYRLVYP